MKQIELRLALVLYGGVSLAVYMHGITREFLNLVRASRRLEAHGAGAGAAARDETSTEVYQRFLALFAPTLDLRVVVDVIAGASAGGVNGVMLARALAHNLSLDGHRDLWLENADVTRLSNEPVGLSRYLKGSIAPVLDRLVGIALKSELGDPETRTKLRQFMQARWFTPPFSGERYVGWMLDAAKGMRADASHSATPSLIPQGQSLDLFVTVTDFHGARRRFAIDDPVEVEETEHRLILRYSASSRGNGEIVSDFTDARIPDLIFSARATSAFPGAFPPMTVGEMDRVLKERGETWPLRGIFLHRAFGRSETPPESRILVDGSVVMNKPFQPVIEAIAGRPAAREVVRRIVYVDPMANVLGRKDEALAADPDSGQAAAEDLVHPDGTLPGFFRVILASLAHIPRNEPIGDALEQVEDYNRDVRQVAEVIAAAEPVVEREVGSILRADLDRPMTVPELTRCRMLANQRAHASAGYAYHGYQRLKLSGVVTRVSELLAQLATARAGTVGGTVTSPRDCEARIETWLAHHHAEAASGHGGVEGPTPQPIIRFLRGLDVDYRIRRLRFVIRRLNRLYRAAGAEMELRPAEMDELKSTLYEQVDHLGQRWSVSFYGAETADAAARLAACAPDDVETIGEVLDQLAIRMGLADLDQLCDDAFSVMAYSYLPQPLRLPLVAAYIGFAFYDLVTLPVLRRLASSEYNEILIDRISPSDPHALRPEGVKLKGNNLNAFGAFFNRRWREHDYLWGRLSAADRLMTMATRAAAPIVAVDPQALAAVRREVFLAILREEDGRLVADRRLVPDLLDEVERMLAEGAGEAAPASKEEVSSLSASA
ncbi:patatin-like protein [Stappia indica]|uniref:Patatin-related protein n=1 Tax=Stappia indica TaxID=538381 RepID=A0A285TIZ0_9HYPH|nr:patatin-like protein [Stappia indica]SOC22283.1 patatin-related protein [Stappia indica]